MRAFIGIVYFPYTQIVALFSLHFFKKNEAKKASLLSNRFAYKGVRRDRHAKRDKWRTL